MKKLIKGLFNNKNFARFYLGFLASVGLSLGSALALSSLREGVKFYSGLEFLITFRIVFSIFYLWFVVYTYRFLEMKKDIYLRAGFLLFTAIFILAVAFLFFF